MGNKNYASRGEKVLMNCFSRGDKVMVEGKGAFLTDANGKVYLDFVSGIAVNALGHANKKLVEALAKQAETVIHTSNYFFNVPGIELAEKLVDLSIFGQVFFANSGAEANEAAIKLARKWGRETKGEDAYQIVTMKESFHGRTMATLTATGQEVFHKDFMPNLEGFSYAEFNNSDSLTELVTDNTCAIMLELIQGEGGVNEVSPEFLATINKLQEEKNILVIIDEVQTGVGRTGTMFAYEQYDIQPDIISLAKGLGGGFPVGAILAKEAVSSHFNPGDHGTTFGGNPLAMASGNAVLEVIKNEKLLDNVMKRRELFDKGIQKLANKYPMFGALKGKGLLIGVELNCPVGEFVDLCYENNLIVTSAKGNVLRLLPPLNVSKKEIKMCLNILEDVAKKMTDKKVEVTES